MCGGWWRGPSLFASLPGGNASWSVNAWRQRRLIERQKIFWAGNSWPRRVIFSLHLALLRQEESPRERVSSNEIAAGRTPSELCARQTFGAANVLWNPTLTSGKAKSIQNGSEQTKNQMETQVQTKTEAPNINAVYEWVIFPESEVSKFWTGSHKIQRNRNKSMEIFFINIKLNFLYFFKFCGIFFSYCTWIWFSFFSIFLDFDPKQYTPFSSGSKLHFTITIFILHLQSQYALKI